MMTTTRRRPRVLVDESIACGLVHRPLMVRTVPVHQATCSYLGLASRQPTVRPAAVQTSSCPGATVRLCSPSQYTHLSFQPLPACPSRNARAGSELIARPCTYRSRSSGLVDALTPPARFYPFCITVLGRQRLECVPFLLSCSRRRARPLTPSSAAPRPAYFPTEDLQATRGVGTIRSLRRIRRGICGIA